MNNKQITTDDAFIPNDWTPADDAELQDFADLSAGLVSGSVASRPGAFTWLKIDGARILFTDEMDVPETWITGQVGAK